MQRQGFQCEISEYCLSHMKPMFVVATGDSCDAELGGQEGGASQASAGSPASRFELPVLRVKSLLHSPQQPLHPGHGFWSRGAAYPSGPGKAQSLLGILIRTKSPPLKAHNSQLSLYTCLYFIGGKGIQRKNSGVQGPFL